MIDLSFSWDDGSIYDLKLAELFNKYDLTSTFFIPTQNPDQKTLQKSDIKLICEMGMDLGGHTQSHTYLNQIPLTKVEEEILSNKFYLEEIALNEIEIFCYPGGKFNDSIQNLVSKHFLKARTAKTMCFTNDYSDFNINTTFHFFDRGKLSMIKNILQNNPNQIKYIFKTFNFNYFESMNNILIDLHNSDKKYKIHIWGHSWEINEFNLWRELENLLILINRNKLNVTSLISSNK